MGRSKFIYTGPKITSWEDVPLIMDLSFAATLLDESLETLKRGARAGTFPAFKSAEKWKVEKTDLQNYIENNKVKPLGNTNETA